MSPGGGVGLDRGGVTKKGTTEVKIKEGMDEYAVVFFNFGFGGGGGVVD